MTPFFSIIIPVYNVAPYLRECLDSVLAQTFTDWEAICIDDGSTDGSGAILDEYAALDSRFSVLHQSNAGVSTARNKGLEVVNGKENGYVWFIDADDSIHPHALNWLKCLAECSNWPKTASFSTNFEKVLDTGKWPELPDVSKAIVVKNITHESLKMHRKGVCGTIVRKDVAREFKFENYKVGEDVLYHMRILWKYPETVLLPASIYYYRTRENSVVNTKPSVTMVSDLLDTEREMLLLFKENYGRWRFSDCKEYLVWNQDFVWYTFKSFFFRVGKEDMARMLPKWLAVQTLQHALLRPNIYRLFTLAFLKFIPSVWLCRILVLGPSTISRRWKALLSRIRRMHQYLLKKKA